MTAFKPIKLLLLTALILTSLPVFAETTALTSGPASLAKNTVTLAQDTAITTYIYAKLAAKPDLANDNIDVSTSAGQVTLNGIVNNNDEAKVLTQLVEATSGVKSVDASKIIIAHQTNALYIKTTANEQPPTTADKINVEPSESAQTVPQKELEISSTDPLLTSPEARQTEKTQLAEGSETPQNQAELSSEPVKEKPVSLKHSTAAKKNHHAQKHLKAKKKPASKKHHKALHAQKVKKPLKKLPSKHKHSKAAKKPKAASTSAPHKKALKPKKTKPKEQSREQSEEQPKKTTASVDEMTKDYLKTALMANKSTPEQ